MYLYIDREVTFSIAEILTLFPVGTLNGNVGTVDASHHIWEASYIFEFTSDSRAILSASRVRYILRETVRQDVAHLANNLADCPLRHFMRITSS